MKKTRIVDGSGYTVRSDEEVDAFIAEQQALDAAWQEQMLPYWEAEIEAGFQQRVQWEQAEYNSRSWWDKLTKPRFIPIR